MENRINIERAVEYILSELWFREFQIIEGRNQHPDGLTYAEWLDKRGLLLNKTLKRRA